MGKPIITVVGSINMDLVVTATKRPEAGETILGEDFYTSPGGKGANQAVAAARLGAEVHMIGRVGDDEFGSDLLKYMARENVFLNGVEPVTHSASGVAMITLAGGDNSIIVYQGANKETTPDYIRKFESLIAKSDVVLTQLEIPIESVEEIAKLCQKHSTQFIINPAPARPLSQKLVENATYLTPNEHEAILLFKGKNQSEVLEQFPNKLFITEGEKGVRYFNGKKEVLVPAFPVQAVDTTGAGDTFNGAFAVALAEGKEFIQAIKFANRAASLSVTKFGAQGGMPTRQEVEAYHD